jgi:hypothetical protein
MSHFNNKIFKDGKELCVVEIFAEITALMEKPVKIKNHFQFTHERIYGNHCNCKNGGEFELLPLDNPAVKEGGKRYMQCRKCNCWSHL